MRIAPLDLLPSLGRCLTEPATRGGSPEGQHGNENERRWSSTVGAGDR